MMIHTKERDSNPNKSPCLRRSEDTILCTSWLTDLARTIDQATPRTVGHAHNNAEHCARDRPRVVRLPQPLYREYAHTLTQQCSAPGVCLYSV